LFRKGFQSLGAPQLRGTFKQWSCGDRIVGAMERKSKAHRPRVVEADSIETRRRATSRQKLVGIHQRLDERQLIVDITRLCRQRLSQLPSGSIGPAAHRFASRPEDACFGKKRPSLPSKPPRGLARRRDGCPRISRRQREPSSKKREARIIGLLLPRLEQRQTRPLNIPCSLESAGVPEERTQEARSFFEDLAENPFSLSKPLCFEILVSPFEAFAHLIRQ
jgi:hypothetical protein